MREIDHHLQPDRQRQRRGDAERQPAAHALGIRDRRRCQRQQRELPAVMVDPLGHEHAVGRAGEEQCQERDRIGARVDQPPRRSAPARTAAASMAAVARSRPPSAPPPPRRSTAGARESARRSASRPAATSGYWRRTAGSADTGEGRTSPGREARRGPASSAYCRRCRRARTSGSSPQRWYMNQAQSPSQTSSTASFQCRSSRVHRARFPNMSFCLPHCSRLAGRLQRARRPP